MRLPDTVPVEALGQAQRPALDWRLGGQDAVAFLAAL